MKIAYIVDCEVSLQSPNSVFKKVLLQTEYWLEKGHKVFVYSLQSGTKLCVRTKRIKRLNDSYQKKDNALLKLYKVWVSSHSIKENIMSNDFDIIYSRYIFYTPFFSNLFNKNLTVMEINSNDDDEYKKASIFTRYYNALFKRKILRYVDQFICVTNELSFYIKKYSVAEVKVIANGIKFPIGQLECLNSNKRPVLSFVASPGNSCHGYDILLKVANVLTDFDFNIVGYSGENKENIIYHGYLEKDKLDDILRCTDIGISALAIQRHGMSEACPLKSREYYSYGLPVIGNYIDTDIDDDLYCKVTSSNLDTSSKDIRNFVEYWMSIPNRKSIVKSRSFIKLNYEQKEKHRLSLMLSLIN